MDDMVYQLVDNGLPMLPEYKSIYRRAEQCFYKFLHHRFIMQVFLITGRNLGPEKTLQILQISALRISLEYNLGDHMTVPELHHQSNLQSLD